MRTCFYHWEFSLHKINSFLQYVTSIQTFVVPCRQSVCPMRSGVEERRKADSINRSLATLTNIITWLGLCLSQSHTYIHTYIPASNQFTCASAVKSRQLFLCFFGGRQWVPLIADMQCILNEPTTFARGTCIRLALNERKSFSFWRTSSPYTPYLDLSLDFTLFL